MKLNWLAYNYKETDGYGRFSNRVIRALLRARACVEVLPVTVAHAEMPAWMLAGMNIDFGHTTIACLPPYYLPKLPPGHGRYWLYSMTEGSELPDGWADIINKSGVERVFVPCAWNRIAFVTGGVSVPVDVLPAGTEPDEFPVHPPRTDYRPYTFLTLADRGSRKGWTEVWSAFYRAFGAPDDTPDVRLVIKTLARSNEVVDRIAGAENPDPRIQIWREDVPNAADIYAAADCIVLPSRGEGWGMPHREAAMAGKPVITLRFGGLDDGYTENWSLPIDTYRLERIPEHFEMIQGEWARADVDALARHMRRCYDSPNIVALRGQQAASWLRNHQTWDRTAARLLAELGREETPATSDAPVISDVSWYREEVVA